MSGESLGEAGHVRDIVSPASLGVSNALNSVGGVRKEGDCAKVTAKERTGIKKIKVACNNFYYYNIKKAFFKI